MYLFSRSYFNDIFNNPGDALITLHRQKSLFWVHVTRIFIFCRITFSEYILNHCITRSSALAYALLLTLIPLVTTASFMIAGFVEVQPEQVRGFFTMLLPFAPDTVLDYMSEAAECDRLLLMFRGRLVAAGSEQDLIGGTTAIEVETTSWAKAFSVLSDSGAAVTLAGRGVRVVSARRGLCSLCDEPRWDGYTPDTLRHAGGSFPFRAGQRLHPIHAMGVPGQGSDLLAGALDSQSGWHTGTVILR